MITTQRSQANRILEDLTTKLSEDIGRAALRYRDLCDTVGISHKLADRALAYLMLQIGFLEALRSGITPEQIGHVIDAAIKLREKELRR